MRKCAEAAGVTLGDIEAAVLDRSTRFGKWDAVYRSLLAGRSAGFLHSERNLEVQSSSPVRSSRSR
jgi:hypothetical protein